MEVGQPAPDRKRQLLRRIVWSWLIVAVIRDGRGRWPRQPTTGKPPGNQSPGREPKQQSGPSPCESNAMQLSCHNQRVSPPSQRTNRHLFATPNWIPGRAPEPGLAENLFHLSMANWAKQAILAASSCGVKPWPASTPEWEIVDTYWTQGLSTRTSPAHRSSRPDAGAWETSVLLCSSWLL